jgi:hypothetical protein
MVTATVITSPSIKVNLPDAATGDATEPSSLGITVGARGELLLDGKPVTEPELRAAVRAAHAANRDVVCLIAGDQAARNWGRWARKLAISRRRRRSSANSPSTPRRQRNARLAGRSPESRPRPR